MSNVDPKTLKLSPVHQQVLEAMKSQLLLVLINRLGGKLTIPVSEIDGSGKFALAMKLNEDKASFDFQVFTKEEFDNVR